MVSQLKEFFRLKNLLGNSLIPLLAFLILGYIQRNVYDWTQLKNRGYERGIEIGGYLFIYILLYILVTPILWIRPKLKVQIYKEGTSKTQPVTSEVFDLSYRGRSTDVTIALEFEPSLWTRKWMERMNKKDLGINFFWSPPNALSCTNRYTGDEHFIRILANGIQLFPFEKMDLFGPNVISYPLRFALGTTEVLQQIQLRPRHLNWKSQLLFGLNYDAEFLFEIIDSRPKESEENIAKAEHTP
jgi:hypothetical protein